MYATADPRAWNAIHNANVGSGFLWKADPTNAVNKKNKMYYIIKG